MLLLLVSAVTCAWAKKNDFGIWTDFAAIKKIHATTLGLTGEVFTKENSSTLDRMSIGLKGDYPLFSWLSAGAGFSLLNFYRDDYQELAERFYLQAVPTLHFNKLLIGFRERIQMTLYPETRTNALTSLYWRNRLEMTYTDSSWKFEPLTYFETFLHLDQHPSVYQSGYRFTLGTNYRLSDHQKIKIYGMLTDGTTVSQYILGLSYEFRL